MPKYVPTEEDLYSTKPCFICGKDVLEEGKEICNSWMCKQQMQIFKEDFEENLMENFLRKEK